jgi:hypothetical protein
MALLVKGAHELGLCDQAHFEENLPESFLRAPLSG